MGQPAKVPTLHGLLLRAQVEQHGPLRQAPPLVDQPLLQLAEPSTPTGVPSSGDISACVVKDAP